MSDSDIGLLIMGVAIILACIIMIVGVMVR